MIEKEILTEKEIQQNYQEFIDLLPEYFKGDRLKKLLKMYSENELGLTLATAPASMCSHWHLSSAGGYILHIFHVIKTSFGVKKLFEISGGNIDFTDEEMVFAACHHDLGKLGDSSIGEYYVPQTESWKTKKGENYKMNPNLPYMEVTDRAIFLLQKYGVTYNWKEFLGIKLADGLYNDATAKYLVQYNPDLFLKTNLPRVIHLADYISACTERDQWNLEKTKTDI